MLYIFMIGVCSILSQDFQVPSEMTFFVASPFVHCNEDPEKNEAIRS